METIKLSEEVNEMRFKAADLFKQQLPLTEVTIVQVSKQGTSKLNRYNVVSTTVSHESNISQFGEEFVDKGVEVNFPKESMIHLNNEASTSIAFHLNVLLPLRKLFNGCFVVESQFTLGKFRVDCMLRDLQKVPFLAIEHKQWNAFINFKESDPTKEKILERIECVIEFPRSNEFPNWYQHTTPNRKLVYESCGHFNLRMGIKQLHAYLSTMGRKPVFGILTTYCHTYFAILEDSGLKISDCVLYSDKNVLRYIANFIQLAINKSSDSTPTPFLITASPMKDVNIQDSRKNRKKRNNEGRQEDTKKRKKGVGSCEDNQCRQEISGHKYVLGGILGRGRSGNVWRLVDHVSGRSFAAKGVDENHDKNVSEEDIIEELHNEAVIYNKLKSLQGKVVPRLYGSVYLYNTMYTLIMEELDADPICPEELSDDEKKAVVAALDKIHSQGVLHCDIREENILIDRRNKCPYFVDFAMSIECVSRKAFEEEMHELRSLLNLSF